MRSVGGDKRGAWQQLAAVPQIFPAVAELDLRRCKASEDVVRAVAQGVPQAAIVRLRIGVTVSVNKHKQVGNLSSFIAVFKVDRVCRKRRSCAWASASSHPSTGANR